MACMGESMNNENILKFINNHLSEKRYNHCISVADEAVKLAKKYNADEEKAYITGLLHDICKDNTKIQMLQIIEKSDIMLSDVEKNVEKLLHAIAGAEIAQKELDIKDNDILNAIRYHTTGRAGMSALEKVIYIADFISADRDYEGVDELRKAASVSMEEVMVQAIIFVIKDRLESKVAIHPDALMAYNEAVINWRLNNV
jgi:predicted HD superfamily hydrolase involved in NAD metabolism